MKKFILIFVITMLHCTKTPEKNTNIKTAVFAEGCFWCAEHVFESIPGVIKAVPGFSGGNKLNATEKEINQGKTGHAEAIEVHYDASKVSYNQLVQVFFDSHDPTTLNKQGPDIGETYKSVAFYQTKEEKVIIEQKIKKLTKQKDFENKIVTEIKPFKKFIIANKKHFNYVKLHPKDKYVIEHSMPRYNAFLKKYKGKIISNK